MFLFVLPFAVMMTFSSLLGVTAASNFVIFSVASIEWQRRRGHRAGEGRLSERENGTYYGVGMDENSDHDITSQMGRLAAASPSTFARFVDKRFDMTLAEGKLLRALLQPAIGALNELEGIKVELEINPQDQDLMQLLLAAVDNLGSLVNPIITYLEQFPEKRIKKL